MTLDDLRGDFRLVLYLIWRHLKLPDPTPLQLDIARYLQHGPNRRMVMAFRGVGKSWITAAFVIWFLLKAPDSNVLVVSANNTRAAKFTNFVLRLIREIPELESLRPRGDDRRSATGFDVGSGSASQTQSVTCVGIFGTFTGDRADLLVADDVEVPKNSETSTLRAKLEERTREFSALLKPGGHIVYLGTPQNEESMYTRLPDRGFGVRVWPILYPNKEQRARYADRLAPSIFRDLVTDPNLEGTSTEPGRFTATDIDARRQDYKEAGFQLQFMLDPSLSSQGEYPLRLSDLLVHPLDYSKGPEAPIWAASPKHIAEDLPNVGFNGDNIYDAFVLPDSTYQPYDQVLMAIDPSGKGRDETGYAVVAARGGYFYLLAAGGVPSHSEADCFKLLDVARKCNVNSIRVEPNYGGGTFASLLMSHQKTHGYLCSIIDSEWARGNKEARILEVLTPIFQAHRLVVNRSIFRDDYTSVNHLPEDEAVGYRLFYQITRMTGKKGILPHDDRVEALAIACHEMAKVLGDRSVDAIARRKDRETTEMVEDFMKCVTLGPRWKDKEKARQHPLNAPRFVSLLDPSDHTP